MQYSVKLEYNLIMTTEKQNTGKIGEDIAVKFLEKNNYKILERNYRKPWGEIDIVALSPYERSLEDRDVEEKELVFVEVKTQNEKFEWRPEENIGFHKKRQLSRIISAYLKIKKISENQNWRVDVVAIKLNFKTKIAQIEHIKNIMLN